MNWQDGFDKPISQMTIGEMIKTILWIILFYWVGGLAAFLFVAFVIGGIFHGILLLAGAGG